MWTAKYWNLGYWTRKYWPGGGGTPPVPPSTLDSHSGYARDIRTGVPCSAVVGVYDQGTTTLSTIYELDGHTLLANPFPTAVGTGMYAWAAADGRYDERITPLDSDIPAYVNPDILLFAGGL